MIGIDWKEKEDIHTYSRKMEEEDTRIPRTPLTDYMDVNNATFYRYNTLRL